VTDHILGVVGVGLVDPAVPLLRGDDLGVIRGDGCFETLRVANAATGKVDAFQAHLARLGRSAARLDLPPPDPAAWRALVADMLAAWGQPGEAALRLLLTRGVPDDAGRPVPTAYALLFPVPTEALRQRRDGVRVVTLDRGMPADAHRSAPWLLGGVKTISYAVNMAAVRHAQAIGADDAIFVSTDGQVLEAPNASVLWLDGAVLRTPPPDPLGILDGTTVRTVFARAAERGLRTEFARGTVEDLRAAAGVWLVSSVRLAVPVTALDGVALPVDADLNAGVQAAAGL
jgi:4-amino-4-deoxychorismate lyase